LFFKSCFYCKFENMNFELATRVDNCTLEDLSVACDPAAETVAAIPDEAMPAAESVTAAVDYPAWDDASTGYQLSLCWCEAVRPL
jgi:hypothetical protein